MRIVTVIIIFVLSISISIAQDKKLQRTFNILKNAKLSTPTQIAASAFYKGTKDSVDVAEAALLLENDVDPKVDIKKYLEQIDNMVKDIRTMTGNNNDARHRINTLRAYLFSVFEMRYDFSDPLAEKRSNQTLSGILETRKGSCSTMPLLFLVLAQRLGYPINPVLLPQHVFLRYSDFPRAQYNLEVTSDGDIFHDDDYYKKGKDYNLTQLGIDSGSYFKTLTHKEYLSVLFSYSAQFFFFKVQDFDKGFRYMETAIQLNPKFANAYRVKASMFNLLRKIAIGLHNEELEERYIDYIQRSLKTGRDLGFTNPDPQRKKEYLIMMSQLEKQQNASSSNFLQ